MFPAVPRVIPALRRAMSAAAMATVAASLSLQAQAAIDPNMAPHAAALERAGERQVATDLLGRYLATAQDDGKAWFQLGRFYILDARDWHAREHIGDPDGQLYLDLAVVAFDQAAKLLVDSAQVYRGMAEMDRALLLVEDSGWTAAHARPAHAASAPLPDYVVELGINILNSCPASGVLLTGRELESVAVWYASVEAGYRADILLVQADLYSTDSIYRRRMAAEMGVEPSLAVRPALTAASSRRPLCIGPTADSAAAPIAPSRPMRLVRVIGPGTAPAESPSIGELLKASRLGGSVWTRDVMAVYSAAARANPILCGGLLLPLGDLPPRACGT